jgi:hypothetical protein
MIRISRFTSALFLAAAASLCSGCDLPNFTPDENEEADPGIWNGRPIKNWILEYNDPATHDDAKAYLDKLGPEDKDLVPALIPLLKDEDPLVRRDAAMLLGQIGPEAKDALEPLSEAFVDPDKRVLRESLKASHRIMAMKP